MYMYIKELICTENVMLLSHIGRTTNRKQTVFSEEKKNGSVSYVLKRERYAFGKAYKILGSSTSLQVWSFQFGNYNTMDTTGIFLHERMQ